MPNVNASSSPVSTYGTVSHTRGHIAWLRVQARDTVAYDDLEIADKLEAHLQGLPIAFSSWEMGRIGRAKAACIAESYRSNARRLRVQASEYEHKALLADSDGHEREQRQDFAISLNINELAPKAHSPS